MADYCRHDLPPGSCADCSPRASPRVTAHTWSTPEPGFWEKQAADAEEAGQSAYGPWITSKYHGTCTGCSFKWEPGDMIRFGEDEGGWICATCGSEDP